MEARPTGFSGDPIAAMSQAVDRIGKAAGGMVSRGSSMEGRDGLAASESRLVAANQAVKNAPGSEKARAEQFRAALQLFQDMENLAPNDPRRIKVAQFLMKLAGSTGVNGLRSMSFPGMDVMGILRMAAGVVSKFGDPGAMQGAFMVEQMIGGMLPSSDQAAVLLRDQLLQRLGVSQSASAALARNWAFQVAKAGEHPRVNLETRTIVLEAQQSQASMAALAKAFWLDRTLEHPSEKNGFVEAFLKVANGGMFTGLGRKYREVKKLAQREMIASKAIVGTSTGSSSQPKEDADMFGALVSFSANNPEAQLPGSLKGFVDNFIH